MSFEVEQKYQVEDVTALECRLAAIGATENRMEEHCDRYFNHPSRDFRESREALRIRLVNDTPLITYKGPKLPGDIKARLEREWRLDPGDPRGAKMQELLEFLGFRPVATVRKKRRCFEMIDPWSDFSVVIDDIEPLGTFAELELVVDDPEKIGRSRDRIRILADHLTLDQVESRSYLSMFLELPDR